MPTYKEDAVSIDQLLLDPNNFRFQDDSDYMPADDGRFAERSVQDTASRRIRGEGLSELKNSILTNGFLPVERLVVREHSVNRDGNQLYLVLEGNRRLAALRWIQRDHEAGVAIPSNVLETLEAVPVIVIDSDDDAGAYLSIMGIRHVGGIKQWGGYQRAKLVAELRDEHGLDASTVASRLGLTPHEVNRRYRALKALGQMGDDDEYSDGATSNLYPIFHEAVSLPVVREWLGWEDQSYRFSNTEELHQFYELIAPQATDGDDDEHTQGGADPKIVTYSQVRELRSILLNPEAKQVLLDPSRSFADALGLARAEELSQSWRTQVSEAIGALGSIGALDLPNMAQEDLAVIRKVKETAGMLLDSYEKLTSN